jgi:6-phospho 3-hexuloisomerase
VGTNELAAKIVEELRLAVSQMPETAGDQLAGAILEANRIFVAGAGRSGLMMKAFAMRLMHLGFRVYVIGETVTPGVDEGDLLLIGSGSGETRTLVGMADKAKSLRAQVAVLTIQPHSSIGALSDIVLPLPGTPKDQSGSSLTIQPMGSLFEQTLLLFLDAVILRLMGKTGQTSMTMFGKHANLE